MKQKRFSIGFSFSNLKQTSILVVIYLLVIYFLFSGIQGKTAEIRRTHVFVLSTCIQIFIAYFLVSKTLFNTIKIGFDKLLYTYRWGILRIVLHSILYLTLYQSLLFVFAFTPFPIFDVSLFHSHFEGDSLSVLIYLVNFIANIGIITLVQVICVLLFKNYIGEILGVLFNAVLLFASILLSTRFEGEATLLFFTDLLGLHFISDGGNVLILLLNKCFFLSAICFFLCFLLKRYNCIQEKRESDSFAHYSPSFLDRPCFGIFRFLSSFVRQQKQYFFLLILLILALYLDEVNFSVPRQLATPLILSLKMQGLALFSLILTFLSVLIPMQLIQELRRNKFYLIKASTPTSNFTLTFSIVSTYFVLFSFLVFISCIAYLFILMVTYGYQNIQNIGTFVLVFFKENLSYFFIGCLYLILYLLSGKRVHAFILLLFYLFLKWELGAEIRSGDLSENGYLLSYFHLPKIAVSDMNPLYNLEQIKFSLLYFFYWLSLISALLLILSGLYSRSKKNLSSRLRHLKQESQGRKKYYFSFFLLFLSLSCAYCILTKNQKEKASYRNRETNYLNYISQYKKFQYSVQPEIIRADFSLDLQPKQHLLEVRGEYVLKNIDRQAIDTLFFTVPLGESAQIKIKDITLSSSNRVLIADSSSHFFAFLLEKALLPGDSISLSYRLDVKQIEIPGRRDLHIADKWSLIESRYFVLTPGYGIYRESYGGREFYPKTQEELAYYRNRKYLRGNRLNPSFRYRLSYPNEQKVIGDGVLESKSCSQEISSRTYTSFPDMCLFNFSILSSKLYEELEEKLEGMTVKVYYAPIHKRGAEGILQYAKKILYHYRKQYGDLGVQTLHIAEVPYYRGDGGSAYSNTLVLDETLFTFDFSDEQHLNPALETLAHELAHFWWGGRLAPSFLPGARALTEGLASYSAMGQMRLFQKQDLIEEYMQIYAHRSLGHTIPIAVLTNDEKNTWLVYFKAPMLFQMISKNTGDTHFQHILSSFLQQSKGTPVSLSAFAEYIQANINTSDSLYIKNLFTKNIEYKNKILSASIQEKGKGRYEISVKIQLAKIQIDSLEKRSQIHFSDIEKIDLSFLKGGQLLREEIIQSDSTEKEIRIIMNERPDEVVLDRQVRYLDSRKDNRYKL